MSAADIATGYRALARVIFGSPGQPRPWANRAACAGEDATLFQESGHERDALAVCASCPVLTECRADALAFERSSFRYRSCPVGVVGGLTAWQRRAMYRAESNERARARTPGEQQALFSRAELTMPDPARGECA